MPNTRALIGDQGATFDNYFVNSSVCCPSRATTLRGQYEHNTGVLSNGGSNGGFEKAYRSGIEEDTIATHLEGAGYRTGLFGKYLNGYPNGAPETYVPLGWTDWASPVRGNAYGEYDYTLNENHVLHEYGHSASAYGTDVYMGLADQFIRDASAAGKPFFAYVSVYAPHEPATPAPGDVSAFPDAQVPRTAAFNQADVSGMPKFVSELPVLTPDEITSIDTLQRLRLESLQAVDRGVATLVDTLRATHHLADTDIVFASDNGFHLGQHRLPAGKLTAYDTDIRVPLLIRGPGIAAGRHVRALTGNVDLTATFAAMAGIKPPALQRRPLAPHGSPWPSNQARVAPGVSRRAPQRDGHVESTSCTQQAEPAARTDRPGSGRVPPRQPSCTTAPTWRATRTSRTTTPSAPVGTST